jgi:hypothetical protein
MEEGEDRKIRGGRGYNTRKRRKRIGKIEEEESRIKNRGGRRAIPVCVCVCLRHIEGPKQRRECPR